MLTTEGSVWYESLQIRRRYVSFSRIIPVLDLCSRNSASHAFNTRILEISNLAKAKPKEKAATGDKSKRCVGAW